MTDADVISLLWKKSNLYNTKQYNGKIPQEYIDYLSTRYSDASCIEESLYRIKYNIEIRPVCKRCGKYVPFITTYGNWHFNIFCSRRCQINQEKIRQAIKKKYNVDNVSQLDFVKEKRISTNIERYGVKNVFNTNERIEKSRKTRALSKEWLEKQKETNIKRYGVDNVAKLKEIKDKTKKTNINKYGTNSWTQTIIGKEKLSKMVSSTEVQFKINKTKKRNNSFNTSNGEEECYKILVNKYPDIIRQYRSDIYPFNCDFYIPSINTYIEYQGSQYHHGHSFDANNENDINELNKLKQLEADKLKNYNTTQYTQIIYTWTDLDVRKRNIAKENKLNYIEIWNINDAYEV